MIVRSIGVNLKVSKLLVSRFFYDLMANSDNGDTKFVGGDLYYKDYPVQIDDEVKDLKFVFECSMDTEGGNESGSV